MTTRRARELPKAPKKYRTMHPKFETRKKAEKEDQYRIRSIERMIKNGPALRNFVDRDLERLTSRIASCESPASFRYMRKQRKRIIGHLWKMIDNEDHEVRAFTVVPPDWRFCKGELSDADPRKLKEAFRQRIIRCAKSSSDGWLFAFVHGEFEPTTEIYQLHIHGVAAAGMLTAVDGLRHQPSLKSTRGKKNQKPIRQPVQVKQAPLFDLPSPLGYVAQSFWPQKVRVDALTDDQHRPSRRYRIGPPHHTEVLLWLDQWSLTDLTLLMGIRRGSQGLIPSR